MKKIICIILFAVMVFSMTAVFSACSINKDKLVCGITEFKPMNYKENNEWTGFDTEFAKLVGEKLGMEVEFVKIDWTNKYSELEAGTINCIWNGFTANADDDGKPRSEYVDFSYSYMLNQQCIVVKAENADNFKKIEDLKGKTAAAEKGSAGESFAKDAIGDTGNMIDSSTQTNTFIEVKSGAVDCAVVDILLAQSNVGKGDYADLVIADITLDYEVYAIGFKKGSDLTERVNKTIKELYDEGKLKELAEKYGLENSLKLDTSFKG